MGRGTLQLDSLTDLPEFILNEGIGRIAVGMVPGENLQGLLLSILGNEPTRTLRDDKQAQQLDSGEDDLEETGHPPGPGGVIADVERAQGDRGGENRAPVPGGLEDGRDGAAVARMGNLGGQRRSSGLREAQPDADGETGAEEGPSALGGCLDDAGDDHDGRPDADAPLAAKVVREVRGRDEGRGAAEGDRRDDQALQVRADVFADVLGVCMHWGQGTSRVE